MQARFVSTSEMNWKSGKEKPTLLQSITDQFFKQQG